MKYVVKNLLHAARAGEVDVIAHQCNCFCRMKSGIAPQIVKEFPEAKVADDRTIEGDGNKLGSVSLAETDFGLIFNLYGQYRYGNDGKQYTNYFALMSCFQEMKKYLPKGTKIGLPKLGCGLAGGDWNIVSKIITKELKDFEITIYVLDSKDIP